MKLLEKYKIDKSKLVNPFSWSSIKQFCKNLISMQGNPSKIALSLALGIFIGVMMPVGMQMAVAIPLAMLFNVNIIITVTATFITNPFTIIPLYYAIIKIGEFLTQIKISWVKIEAIIKNPEMKNFLALGYESLIVFFTGSFTLGLITSVFLYLITLRLIKNYRANQSS